MNMKLDLNWIIDEFNKLKIMGEVITRARILFEKLIALSKQKISEPEVLFSDFFALAIAFRFTTILINERYFMPPADIYVRRRNEVIPRPTLPSDVDNMLVEINVYWEKNFPVLLKKVQSTKNSRASAWLDLLISTELDLRITRTFLIYKITNDNIPVTTEHTCGGGSYELIVEELEQIVRYDQYNLSKEKEIQQSKILPMTYSIKELLDRWGTNHKNVIAVCNKSTKFWAYINITKELRLENFNHRKMTLEIRNQMDNGEIDSEYKYSHQGFARVAKESSVNGGITLTYFYSNPIVEAKRGRLILLWVEPPLCNRVLGIYSQHIESDKAFSPELHFMQKEIHLYEESDEFKQFFPTNKVTSTRKKNPRERKKSAEKNGKKSGVVRRESADCDWNREKPAILHLANELRGNQQIILQGLL